MRPALLVPLVAPLLATLAHADPRPLWEIGLGAAVLDLPNYRGSDARHTWLLPLPYLVYRGDVLRLDREGLRGVLFNSERVELNVSVNGSLPARSDDDPVRQGMPDLDPTVEVGPTLDFKLWRSNDRRRRLDLRLPVRTALTVASDPQQIGWLFSPNVLLQVRDPAGFAGWKLGVQAGPYFNNREYNAYFYGVAANQATAFRPAYRASGGYSGAQAMLTLTRRFPRYWVGGFVRYDTLAGTVIDDSPLVQRKDALSAGIGVSWVFRVSNRRVDIDPLDD